MELNLNLFELKTIYDLLDYELCNTDGHSDEDYKKMEKLKERVDNAIQTEAQDE